MTGVRVAVGQRLEEAAAPGEVLIGEPTLALVGDAAEVEPVEPLPAAGRAGRRLPASSACATRRSESTGCAFVGRERELALVGEVWERARTEQRCELVTIVGDAGVGKSRLAAELLASIEAQVVRGRCLPYGEAITYWPVVEVLKQLDAAAPDEAAARSDPLAARRDRGVRRQRGRDRLGVPQDARARRGGAAARRRLRRHPLGRGDASST